MTKPPTRGFYLVSEAAAALGVKPRHVNWLIAKGKIIAEQSGGIYMITADEVARYQRDRKPRGRQPKGA